MATRAEKSHADQQRHGITPAAKKRAKARKTAADKATPHPTAHAGKKAVYAIEPRASDGRASRKSTRGDANRMKADTNLNLREEMQKGSPESRFRKSRAKQGRVRGHATAP